MRFEAEKQVALDWKSVALPAFISWVIASSLKYNIHLKIVLAIERQS